MMVLKKPPTSRTELEDDGFPKTIVAPNSARVPRPVASQPVKKSKLTWERLGAALTGWPVLLSAAVLFATIMVIKQGNQDIKNTTRDMLSKPVVSTATK